MSLPTSSGPSVLGCEGLDAGASTAPLTVMLRPSEPAGSPRTEAAGGLSIHSSSVSVSSTDEPGRRSGMGLNAGCAAWRGRTGCQGCAVSASGNTSMLSR